jgi:hypothetical protein
MAKSETHSPAGVTGLPFAVIRWDETGLRHDALIAACDSVGIARAAYEAALLREPRAWITLQAGIRVIDERRAT